jgi:hypothetical protein
VKAGYALDQLDASLKATIGKQLKAEAVDNFLKAMNEAVEPVLEIGQPLLKVAMIKLYLIKLHSSRMFIELFLHILKSSKN